MRYVLAISLLVLVAAGIASAATPAQSPKQPTLRLVSKLPLTVVGARFGAGELVRVVARGRGAMQRRIRVARDGSFRVTLETWTLDRCGTPLVIQAFGIRSGVVSLKLPPQPACPPPLDRIDP